MNSENLNATFQTKARGVCNKQAVRSLGYLEISILIRILNAYSHEQIFPALCFNFIHNVGLTFHYEISLHYSLILKEVSLLRSDALNI